VALLPAPADECCPHLGCAAPSAELSAEFPRAHGGGGGAAKLYVLPELAAAEAPAIREAAEASRGELDYSRGPDSVDGEPTYECALVVRGHHACGKLEPLLRPIVERVLLYAAWRYGCAALALSGAILRRYLPGERRRHPVHFDGAAYATAVVGLDAPGAFAGGLYVQPTPSAASREFVPLGCGDVAVHRYDLRHGVRVYSGERYSLVLWLKPSLESVISGSLPWYQQEAEEGDADAQHSLGRIFEQGRGRDCEDRDDVQAAKWYSLAAAQGHAGAICALGCLAFAGRGGLAAEASAAASWWRRAAELGDGQAQRLLAMLLQKGAPGVAQDLKAASEWLSAAEEGEGSEEAAEWAEEAESDA